MVTRRFPRSSITQLGVGRVPKLDRRITSPDSFAKTCAPVLVRRVPVAPGGVRRGRPKAQSDRQPTRRHPPSAVDGVVVIADQTRRAPLSSRSVAGLEVVRVVALTVGLAASRS